MSFNLTTDDVWDERERMGLNNKSMKKKSIWQVKNPSGEVVLTGTIDQLKGKVRKYFGKTARWAKRGRWRLLIDQNDYTISKVTQQ